MSLRRQDINELVEKKLAKEENRFIKQWPEEKISIENGRWGPFIRFNKKMLKFGKKADNEKYTPEELADIDIEVDKTNDRRHRCRMHLRRNCEGLLPKKSTGTAKKAAAKKKKSS
jgi:DNA topoisomerase-1